jgi:hypothetical protein
MPIVPNKPIMLSIIKLSVTYAECHRQTHYAEWYYAECPYVECPKQTHYAEYPYAECR